MRYLIFVRAGNFQLINSKFFFIGPNEYCPDLACLECVSFLTKNFCLVFGCPSVRLRPEKPFFISTASLSWLASLAPPQKALPVFTCKSQKMKQPEQVRTSTTYMLELDLLADRSTYPDSAYVYCVELTDFLA